MTNNRSIAEIIREVAGMQKESITDAYALDLHKRHLRAAGRSEETIRARAGAVLRLADFLDPYGKRPRAVLEATSDQLAAWQSSCDHLSEKSVAIYVGHIQLYYRWCVRPMRIVDESPAEDLLTPIVKRRLPRPVPEEDLDFALLACTDGLHRAWILLGAYAGLRSVDIVRLDRDDVLTDRELPVLRVRGKGGHEDLVIVGHEVIRALAPYYGGRRGPMFADADGKRLKPRHIYGPINSFFNRLGLPYTFHQLRHRYGSHLYDLTRDIKYTQQQLRHTSVRSTEVYVQTPADKAAKSVKQLDAEAKRSLRDRSA